MVSVNMEFLANQEVFKIFRMPKSHPELASQFVRIAVRDQVSILLKTAFEAILPPDLFWMIQCQNLV